MSEKYIRQEKNSYKIIKNSRVYGKFDTMDDAIFIRDLLIKQNWNLNNFTLEMHLSLDRYVVVKKIDGKLHILGKFKDKPNDKLVEKLTKKIIRNPNNSKYGLNISRVFEIFMVKKQIAGEEHIFGIYENLESATFVRNFLLENNWDVRQFGEIEFDDENDTYKITTVIDEKVCVLGGYPTFSDAYENIENAKKEFLRNVYKQKYGLASYPHLNYFVDFIDEIENEFGFGVSDENWNFENVSQNENVSDVALNEIVFNLTPWQKIIYDNVRGEFTSDELKKKLIRYKSRNFDEKVMKNLEDLINLGLVEKLDENKYSKL